MHSPRRIRPLTSADVTEHVSLSNLPVGSSLPYLARALTSAVCSLPPKHAYEFGKATLPRRGSFKTLYDALQLQACGVATPTTGEFINLVADNEHVARGGDRRVVWMGARACRCSQRDTPPTNER